MRDSNSVFAKVLSTTAKFSSFFVIAISVVLYVLFSVLRISGDLPTFFADPANIAWTVINTGITVMIHQVILSTAYDNAIAFGVDSEEFKMGDALNAQIIKKIGRQYDDFIDFITKLNLCEKRNMETNFIRACGKRKYEELTDKEKKAFKGLKPLEHDISNILMPCYAIISKDGKISYDASFRSNKTLIGKRIKKIVIAFLFAFINLGPAVISYGDFGMAVITASIMAVSVSLTFVTTFVPVYCKLRYAIPKAVMNKDTLIKTYDERKATIEADLENHKELSSALAKVAENETKPIEEAPKEESEDGGNKLINQSEDDPTQGI